MNINCHLCYGLYSCVVVKGISRGKGVVGLEGYRKKYNILEVIFCVSHILSVCVSLHSVSNTLNFKILPLVMIP